MTNHIERMMYPRKGETYTQVGRNLAVTDTWAANADHEIDLQAVPTADVNRRATSLIITPLRASAADLQLLEIIVSNAAVNPIASDANFNDARTNVLRVRVNELVATAAAGTLQPKAPFRVELPAGARWINLRQAANSEGVAQTLNLTIDAVTAASTTTSVDSKR